MPGPTIIITQGVSSTTGTPHSGVVTGTEVVLSVDETYSHYEWQLVSRPVDPSLVEATDTLSSTTGPSVTITPTVRGTYKIRLIADHGVGLNLVSELWFYARNPSDPPLTGGPGLPRRHPAYTEGAETGSRGATTELDGWFYMIETMASGAFGDANIVTSAGVTAGNFFSPAGAYYLGPDTDAGSLRSGSGVPDNGVGADGSLYLRTDGTSVTTAYVKAGGAWSALGSGGGGGGSPTGSAGGDLGGTYPNPSVVGIQGRAVVSTTPSNGQVYAWDETNTRWGLIDVSPVTFAGDLSGSNSSQSVTGIQGTAVAVTAPQLGQYLQYDGSQWLPTYITELNLDQLKFRNSILASINQVAAASSSTVPTNLTIVSQAPHPDGGVLTGKAADINFVVPSSVGMASSGSINFHIGSDNPLIIEKQRVIATFGLEAYALNVTSGNFDINTGTNVSIFAPYTIRGGAFQIGTTGAKILAEPGPPPGAWYPHGTLYINTSSDSTFGNASLWVFDQGSHTAYGSGWREVSPAPGHKVISSDYTLESINVNFVLVSSTGLTVTLITAPYVGKRIIVKSSGTHGFTVSAGGGTIDGSSTLVIPDSTGTPHPFVELEAYTTTSWYVVSSNA